MSIKNICFNCPYAKVKKVKIVLKTDQRADASAHAFFSAHECEPQLQTEYVSFPNLPVGLNLSSFCSTHLITHCSFWAHTILVRWFIGIINKISGWIFTIGWLFSHTVATQRCQTPFKSVFLHNRSPLNEYNYFNMIERKRNQEKK